MLGWLDSRLYKHKNSCDMRSYTRMWWNKLWELSWQASPVLLFLWCNQTLAGLPELTINRTSAFKRELCSLLCSWCVRETSVSHCTLVTRKANINPRPCEPWMGQSTAIGNTWGVLQYLSGENLWRTSLESMKLPFVLSVFPCGAPWFVEFYYLEYYLDLTPQSVSWIYSPYSPRLWYSVMISLPALHTAVRYDWTLVLRASQSRHQYDLLFFSAFCGRDSARRTRSFLSKMINDWACVCTDPTSWFRDTCLVWRDDLVVMITMRFICWRQWSHRSYPVLKGFYTASALNKAELNVARFVFV